MANSRSSHSTFHEPHIEPPITVPDPESFAWAETADVVVVGFGGAGVSAALEARAEGADTLVLERFSGGGATVLSGGVVYAGGGTEVQKQAGVEDTPEQMFQYLKQEVRGAVTDATLRQFCEESVDQIEWLKKHGVPFHGSLCPFKTSYPPNQYYLYYSGNESFPPYSDTAKPAARGHRAHQKGISGESFYKPLQKSALAAGVRKMPHCKVVGLLKDQEGRVIGVRAMRLRPSSLGYRLHQLLGFLHIAMRYPALYFPSIFQCFARLTERVELGLGEVVDVRARRGVILSTGGFYGNQAMIQRHAPQYLGGSPLGTLADDGSGISMAQAIGGKTALMENVSAWRFFNPPYSFVKGVLVGPSGKRICNEMLYGAEIGERIVRDNDGKAWMILDRETYRSAYGDLSLKKALWFHVMLALLYMWFGSKKARTLRDLAEALGIDAETLQSTIDQYNRIARSEEPDPKGKPKGSMAPLSEEGPFYAVDGSYHFFFVSAPSLTLGGLQVEEATGQVIGEDGKAIQGLYAAGRTAVGLPSRGYVSGLSLADCVFSGRRAGRHAGRGD